jgi:hypothetical protein
MQKNLFSVRLNALSAQPVIEITGCYYYYSAIFILRDRRERRISFSANLNEILRTVLDP